MTFGLSRDDVGRFLPTYLKHGLLESDPFQSIDEAGVGQLVKMSALAAKEYYSANGKGTETCCMCVVIFFENIFFIEV